MKHNSKHAHRIQQTPKFAVKFANAVFVAGLLFSVLIAVYALYRLYMPIYDVHLGDIHIHRYYFTYILIGAFLATLFVFALRLRNRLKAQLSLLLFTTVISVYVLELYLELSRLQVPNQTTTKQIGPQQKMAETLGVPYDTRSGQEILDGLRKAGIVAYPNVFPSVFPANSSTRTGLNTRTGTIFPLGTISNITTIFGNESGYYPIVETDEHGFNNPKGLYNTHDVDIVLTGDSFTEGWSVHSAETIGAVLTGAGFKAISIGKAGNGPLIELAALKEYAEPFTPPIVLWLYYVNDILDLVNELNSPILRRYLNEEDFTQHLISRQDETDNALIHYVEGQWDSEIEKQSEQERQREQNASRRPIRVFKLMNLRKGLNLTPKPVEEPEDVFINILETSKTLVSGWGGKMYFVYLPSFGRYSVGNENGYREFVLRTTTELDIPVIDIHEEVFVPHPDPLTLFPFSVGGHYNAEGYRLAAEAISKRLKADGFKPLNSNN